MSEFDVKDISENDAFRLETAVREETNAVVPSDPQAAPQELSSTDLQNSAVAEVLTDVLSHWIEADETSATRFAEQAGDPKLEQKISGLSEMNAEPQGITGDFKADSAGPEDGIDVPPQMDGGEFGGGGGGDGGDARGAWEDPDTTAAEAEAAATAEADERGFDPGGGDGGGDDEEPDEDDEPPPEKNKPKK